jgi:thiol-disulfide isomerase/thioredoxin
MSVPVEKFMSKVTMLSLLVLTSAASLLTASSDTNEYANEPGWEWIVAPKPASYTCWSDAGVLGTPHKAHDGSFEIFIAWEPSHRSAYRAVAFDSTGQRYNLEGSGAGTGNFTMHRFRHVDSELPYETIKSVGFEVLSPDGWATQSKISMEEASRLGPQTLPLPVVGEIYTFALTTHDGRELHAVQFRGSVLLIDCWATWCKPCMRKMPALKAAHQKWSRQGLSVLGVNYDYDRGKFLDEVEELELPWDQVAVPADKDSRRIWYESSSIRSLPRFIVVGRDGRVVADLQNPERTLALVDSLVGH